MIEFECPHCGNVLRVEPAHAGRHAWCRRCKRVAIVPQGSEPPVVAGQLVERRRDLAGHSPTTPELADGPASAAADRATVILAPAASTSQEVIVLRAQLNLYSKNLDDLATELDAVRSQREELRHELERAREELGAFARRAADAEQALAKQEHAFRQQTHDQSVNSTWAQEQNKLLASLAEAKEEARLAKQSVELSQQTLADMRRRTQELEELAQQSNRQREETLEFRSEKGSLLERLAKLESLLKHRDAALAEVQDRHDRLAQEATRAETALEALRERENSHQREMEQIQLRLTEAEHAAEVAKAAADSRESERSELSRKLETVSAAHAALESSAAGSAQELSVLQGRLSQAEDDLRGLERDAEEAQVLARDKEQETLQLRAELSDAKTSAEEASQETGRLRLELEETKATLEALRAALEAERQEGASERPSDGQGNGKDDLSLPDTEPADVMSTEIVAQKEDEDQTLLVDALLRFLGRK